MNETMTIDAPAPEESNVQPETRGNNKKMEFKVGQKIILPEGTEMVIAGVNRVGDYVIYETQPGQEPFKHSMAPTEVQALIDDLAEASNQTADEPATGVNEVYGEANDEGELADTGVVLMEEPQPEVPPVDPVRTLADAQAELNAARAVYGNLPVKDNEEANELRSKIQGLHIEVIDWEKNHSDEPNEAGRRLSDAKAELAAARMEYGNSSVKDDGRANELRRKIQALHNEVIDWPNAQSTDVTKVVDVPPTAAEKTMAKDKLDETLEAAVPGYKALGEDERKAVRDALKDSGVLKDEALAGSEGSGVDVQVAPNRTLSDAKAELAAARLEYRDLSVKDDGRASALRRKIQALHNEVTSWAETPAKPEVTSEDSEKARNETMARVDTELRSTEQFKDYRAALNKYAEINADNNTKSFIFGLGRKKHERLMEEATSALLEAKKALVTEMIKHRKEAGLYEGEAAQAMSDDAFAEIRKLDPDTRNLTDRVLIERKGNRNVLQRVSVKFGHFLNRGDKALSRYAKNAGVGLGVGLLKGATVGLMGAWPVGVLAGGVGAGIVAAGRYGAKMSYLDESLKARVANQGDATQRLSDEQFAALLKKSQESADSTAAIPDKLASEILRGSQKADRDAERAARIKANKNVGAFGVGMAIGSYAGFSGGRTIHDAWQAAHSHVSASAASTVDVQPAGDKIPSAPPVTEVAPKAPELLGNSFNVESGNGLIKEWSQWATANGHHIDGQTSQALHEAVLKKFGPNGIIDLNKVSDAKEIYTQGNDVRIAAPGAAHWRTGVADYAQQWLQQQGKW